MPTTNAPYANTFAAAPGKRRALTVLTILIAALAVAMAPAANTADAAKKKQRIAALTPFTVQTLAKLKVKPAVIGETVTGDVGIPKKFRNVPQIPLSHASNGPNAEQLIEREIDLVLSERTWKGGHGALGEFGMKVREMDPTRIGQYKRKIQQVGKLVGKKRQAKRLARSIQKRIRKAKRGISTRPRTLVLLGVGQSRYAFLPNSWGGNLFSQAGATLATEDLTSDGGSDLLVSGGFAQLSPEEILVQTPDVIVAVPHGNAEDLDEIAESLREDPWLAQTNAGANDRIYVSSDNSLLQPDLQVPRVIKMIRGSFLLNR